MAINGIGFDGSVDEAAFSKLMVLAGLRYAVASSADFATTPVNGVRAVSTAPGSAYGAGVLAISGTAVQTNLPTPAVGQFFLIAVHRDWAANTCTIIAVDGPTTTAAVPTAAPSVLPVIDSSPGVKDDQPLYWAWVNNTTTTVTMFDLRTFTTDARLSAVEQASVPREGTTAARDFYYGTPTTAAARVALAGKRWYNTQKGYWERYYSAAADAGANAFLSSTVANWLPDDHPGNMPFVQLALSSSVNWVEVSLGSAASGPYTESSDLWGWHDQANNPSYIRPNIPGRFRLDVFASMPAAGSFIRPYVNGAGRATGGSGASSLGGGPLNASDMVDLNGTTDYVTVNAYGNNQTFTASFIVRLTYMGPIR